VRATSAKIVPTTAVMMAAVKHARRATCGLRAPNTRCMKSIATTSPMPSATRVAQLIGAPWAALVSCSKSNGPIPSGMTMPSA
jgi:hypothetical protein